MGTASSHSAECVSTGTQSGRLHTNTDRVFPGFFFFKEKKERKQYNTENQFVLISTFQIPLTLCYTPALSVIPNSAKKRIKDVQIKQETRYMLLCADT